MDTQEKKKILIENTTELVNAATKYMLETIESACNCGAIDIESYDGTYRLPKKILSALCKQASYRYFTPRNDDDEEDVENIFFCI